MSRKTIFLSHSSKDIDKVRKIRDILEYEPLLFHMKCLDDDNETLEDFIKREIDARNIFVYYKSKNSESSIWVQKELAYIKESSNKRLYEIDIEKPLSETLVDFLHTLANIIKKEQNIYLVFSCR
ncbi:MAG: toll/interleukin-1 receptor domain-containing protein [Clostridia bacterium]|nr:toll/interleukin-1 receptor domain-containing protein [Clostridia bacterium]